MRSLRAKSCCSRNTERSKKVQNVLVIWSVPKTKKSVPVIEEKPEPEIPDEEGGTPKQSIFVMEYLRDFNATRAAMAAEYS
ncbi:terminase small subunit [Paenibacillus polymyxa]|uniref:terminase small subunit n=1 Tax=Paenibacillus polymyxa TaxID=1406 RepID=UPI003BA93049